jgi:hypothetical protein
MTGIVSSSNAPWGFGCRWQAFRFRRGGNHAICWGYFANWSITAPWAVGSVSLWQGWMLENGPFQAHTKGMNIPTGIIVGFLILAATGAVLFRWELQILPNPVVFRLDRWTGQVVICSWPPSSADSTSARKLSCAQ